MQQDQPSKSPFVPASGVIDRLHRAAPKDGVTVQWVLDRLYQQSFGVVLLLLAIVAVVPGICSFAGLLLAISGFEMAVGRSRPYFPQWIGEMPTARRPWRP